MLDDPSRAPRHTNGIAAFLLAQGEPEELKLAAALGTAVLGVAQAIQRIAEQAAAFFARPEVQAHIRDVATFMEAANRRIEAIESPGYQPYFESLGHDAFAARLHGGLIQHFARRLHEESQERRIALKAFHNLARRRRWHAAAARQVTLLCEHASDAAFLGKAFRDAGCLDLEAEFVALLQRARHGDRSDGLRLIEIAESIAPHAPSARGRPVDFDSLLHQRFLDWSKASGGRQGYTYGPVQKGDDAVEDFIDAATAATRIEQGRPSFNPTASRRAMKRLRAREVERDNPGGLPEAPTT